MAASVLSMVFIFFVAGSKLSSPFDDISGASFFFVSLSIAVIPLDDCVGGGR